MGGQRRGAEDECTHDVIGMPSFPISIPTHFSILCHLGLGVSYFPPSHRSSEWGEKRRWSVRAITYPIPFTAYVMLPGVSSDRIPRAWWAHSRGWDCMFVQLTSLFNPRWGLRYVCAIELIWRCPKMLPIRGFICLFITISEWIVSYFFDDGIGKNGRR